ncbi:HET domain-containing protein [Colletotrichum graminicola]|nr:HET domain-containing protein [Colletotrichum graminicola]
MGLLKKIHREKSGQKDHKSLSHAQEDWLSAKQDSSNDRVAPCQHLRDGLMTIFEDPWLTPIWILQEVFHARPASVCCGRWSAPAYMLATAAKLVGVDSDSQVRADLDVVPTPSMGRSAKTKSLQTLLLQFRGSHATDPRDMVYASDISEDDPTGPRRLT